MRVKYKEWQQRISRPLAEVWQFFSRPENLDEMTPGDVKFQILSDISGQEMFAGMIIDYTIRPILNIPLYWVTEITHVKEGEYFIDEQRVGPYAMWHHQHLFFPQPDGSTLMVDKLHYRVGMGPLGSLANALFVERKVEEIFQFRRQAVEQFFGA